MENIYSLAILPSEEGIELVKSLKEELFKKIKWFNSQNSVAHITICEFEANEKEIEIIKNQLSRLCDSVKPFEIHLNKFDAYPNGTFFISPDEDSEKNLKPLMKRFHQSLRIRNMQKSTDSHLSIARRLTSENLQIAKRLLTQIDETFLCDKVVLRKLDKNIKQYFVTDSFTFNSNPTPELIQGTLF